MAYGSIKVDNIVFTNGGVDQTVTVSGIVQSISGNITATGTIQGATVIGTSTVSGATVTGDAGVFTIITGGTAGFTTVTGTTVTGTTANFVTVSGTTVTGTTANFGGTVTAVTIQGTTTVSGATVTGATGQFTTVTGGTAGFTTITGATVTGTTANFTTISGTTITGGHVTTASGTYTGSVTAASFIPTSSTVPTNGVYLPAANSVALATNGQGRLFIDASGNVGIGTTAPAQRFHVSNGAILVGGTLSALQASSGAFDFSGGATRLISMGADASTRGSFAFLTSTTTTPTTPFVITSDGNIGIGNSSPTTDGLSLTNNYSIGFNANSNSNVSRIRWRFNGVEQAWIERVHSDGSLAFGVFNQERLRIASTGELQFNGLGSATAPILSFTTDTNTGIYSPGADQLAISSNGVGRLFIDASGKITSSSAWTSTAAGQLVINNTTNLSSNQTTEYANIELRRDGVDGVYNPVSAWLSVYQYSTDGNANSALAVSTSPAGSGSRVKVIDIRHTDISFFTGAQGGSTTTERMRLDSSGRLGLGTSSPQAILSTKPSASTTTAATTFTGDGVFIDCANTTDSNGSYGGAISWSRSGSSTTRAAAICNVQTATDPDFQGLAFLTHNSGTSTNPLTEAMRITSGGLVGIGTTSPGRKLSIADSVAPTLGFYRGSTEDGLISSEAAGFAIQTFNNTPIQFSVVSGSSGYSERARIDSSGRLLVGTSSQSGGSLLQVNDNRIRIATAKTPASATDTGVAGEICWDANYVYVCTATNTWKRTAISTW